MSNHYTKVLLLFLVLSGLAHAQLRPVVPPEKRGTIQAERSGTHDANNIRTVFYNYGMVGDYPADPIGVDLSVFHSMEVPRGSGLNYSDGATPYVLARVLQQNGFRKELMLTGYRERQATEPFGRWVMRLEPRPGYFQADPTINRGRSPAISNDSRTWPDEWPDKLDDATDPGWKGSWNGYFGKRAAADQESFYVVDDNYYTSLDFYPDSRDNTRRGLGFSMEVRGFQWSNPQAGNVIFYHYDVINESDTDYNDNLLFGIYMDSGVGGSAISCDGIAESDDDNAFFDKSFGLNLTYTWDTYGHGVGLSSTCVRTGYLGYAYLETPGNPFDLRDNDQDGVTDEKRDGGSGTLIQGAPAIRSYAQSNYTMTSFENFYGTLDNRPAYKTEYWWTGDEDMDWVAEFDDTGVDGVLGTSDVGEGDGKPTAGEPNFDKTDIDESDQIGLTGFKMNRIRAGSGNPSTETDGIVFYDDGIKNWPKRLYDQFTDPTETNRFDQPLALNYNIGFLFTSGTFKLQKAKQERFSLALAYGIGLSELRTTVKIVQRIYTSNYQFVVPPRLPILTAQTGDKFVRLTWSDFSERSADPVTRKLDFEGYKIYRSTDPVFLDTKTISNGRGTDVMPFGTPIAQFDLNNDKEGYSAITVDGVAYYLGENTGITHTYIDTTVTNGMTYYYAACAYDHGDAELGYYPSENAINISRTARGGTILPQNAVEVRPNPKALGFQAAEVSSVARVTGSGVGSVQVKVVNSDDVPDGRTLQVRMKTTAPENVHADYYQLVDSASAQVYIERGTDFGATGNGAVGAGILPLVSTIATPEVDSIKSGFTVGSKANVKLTFTYLATMPINMRRTGYPNNLEIEFSDTVVDTSLPFNFLIRAKPVKFRISAMTATGRVPIKCFFLDGSGSNDSTLSTANDLLYITSIDPASDSAKATWNVRIDTAGLGGSGVPPQPGDRYQLSLRLPFQEGEVFSFRATGQKVDQSRAKQANTFDPYVVPNPYVAAASFEPERFAVSGRGERRLEFRGLPSTCTIRIFTIRGELVQTLRNENSLEGYVPWNLRTKDNLDVAPGLYIFHVDAGDLGSRTGKFSIIK